MEKGVITSRHRNSNVPQGGRNPERQSPQHCFSIALFMPKGSTMLGHVHNAILCNGIEFNTSGQKKQKKNTHQTPRMTLKHSVNSEVILQLGTTRDSVFQKQLDNANYALSQISYRATFVSEQSSLLAALQRSFPFAVVV